MTRFARVEANTIVEIIDVPDISVVSDLYHPDFVRTLVDITSAHPMPGEMWSMNDQEQFSPPVPRHESLAETGARNAAFREELLTRAALEIAPLQDAVDLGIETDEELALLKAWKLYRVNVNRMELLAAEVDWPELPG